MPCISGSYHTKPRIKNATRNSFIFIHQASTAHHYYRHHLDHHNLLQQKDDKRMVCIRWNIPWALARLYPKCRLATLSAGGRRIRLCTISIKEDHQRWIRGGICHSRHSRRECKIFASGVNFSRNNAVCYINESKKLHFILISSLKLLTYY